MKAEIHPSYREIAVTCSCGNKFKVNSTYREDKLSIDVCNKCHPFYSGQKRIVDATGRVEKFNLKYSMPSITKAKKEQDAEKDK